MSKPKADCTSCKHYEEGVLHGYPWATCAKNWSDKQNGVFWQKTPYGVFWGVLKNWCGNYVPKQKD